jgi:hypothetical protein
LIHRVIFEIAIAIYFKDSVSLSNVIIPKHKEEATDDIREKGERGQKNGRSIQTRNK